MTAELGLYYVQHCVSMKKRAVEASDERHPVPDIRIRDIVAIKLVSFGCDFYSLFLYHLFFYFLFSFVL